MMISVAFAPPCERLLRMLELSPHEVRTTINDWHSALIVQGLSRLTVAHWFTSERLVFVEALITEKNSSSGELRIEQVLCELAIELRTRLPAGILERALPMEALHEIVAKTFGSPVTAHPDQPSAFLYSGPWDGLPLRVQSTRGAQHVLIATYFPELNHVERAWAFHVDRYREWFREAS